METTGRVQNGVVILDDSSALPDGAVVVISCSEPPPKKKSGKRVKLPLVPSDNPGSLQLTNEMIAEIMDEEDAAPRR